MAKVTCAFCSTRFKSTAHQCPNCYTPHADNIHIPTNPTYESTEFEKTDAPTEPSTGIDWRSQIEIFGIPLIHIAFGRDANRQVRVAKGIIAIGQFGIGLITIAQMGVGLLFGFGQMVVGFTAIGQIAISLAFGIGQLATGYVAIGQLALGYYALGQAGLAVHLWSTTHRDELAVMFFRQLAEWLKFWT